MSMNANAKLYEQKLGYNRSTGPYQSLSLPWWVRTPEKVYGPRHGCELEPVICGENLFRRLDQDIRNAKHCIDIISWGCLLYTSPSPRDRTRSRMPSSA